MQKTERVEKIVVAAVLLVILLTGLLSFSGYGLSTDESIQRQHSLISYRSVMRTLLHREVFPDAGPALQDYPFKYYGVAMQLPLVFAEDMYQLMTGTPMQSATVFQMRHLYTFLVYYFALVCFYLLLNRLFENRRLAIAGVLTVFLFGQFFAHSFYNIKDLLFASLFMISLCCAERVFATGRKPVWCLLFALSGALLVTSRIVGAVLIVLVLCGMLLEDIARARGERTSGAPAVRQGIWKRLTPYLLVCCALPLWVAVTPAAWSNPVAFALGYIGTFADYQDPTAAAKAAEAAAAGIVTVKANTRFYFLTHIAASVPVVTQAFAVLGLGAFAARAVSRHKQVAAKPESRMLLWLMLLILLVTLLYQAVCQPNVYGGWRHAYYLYPIIAVYAVYGMDAALSFARARKLRLLQIGVVCAVAGSLAVNAVRIAVNHPYESAMNNVFARNTAVARERDYWRLTYYDLAKWVLADAEGEARVCLTDPTGNRGWIVDQLVLRRLPDAEAERLVFGYLDESDYVLQNYAYVQGNEWPVEGFSEVYAIWVDGLKIAAVARRVG